MTKKLSFAVLGAVVLAMTASPVFAAGFIGVGGDADFFPRNWLIGSVFITPLLYYEGIASSTIFGGGIDFGGSDISLSLSFGQQASNNFIGMGLRKKIYGGDNTPFSLALFWNADALTTNIAGIYSSYMGAVISKKVDKIHPYLGLVSSTYYTRSDLSGSSVWTYIYGGGLAGGVRYDFDDKWSGRAEVNYNSFTNSTALPWPKSVFSVTAVGSYRL